MSDIDSGETGGIPDEGLVASDRQGGGLIANDFGRDTQTYNTKGKFQKISNVSTGPVYRNPFAHDYGDQTVDGYVVCSLCGRVENAKAAGGTNCLYKVLEKYKYAAAELAGTNSAVDVERRAKLFMKHREIAQELQRTMT